MGWMNLFGVKIVSGLLLKPIKRKGEESGEQKIVLMWRYQLQTHLILIEQYLDQDTG
jgi:hypothetical protein